MNLEDELRLALRREEPPRDFSAPFRPRPRRFRTLCAIAAGLIVCVLLPYGVYERQQAEGRAAKRELVLALKVAGDKLRQTKKILRSNSL